MSILWVGMSGFRINERIRWSENQCLTRICWSHTHFNPISEKIGLPPHFDICRYNMHEHQLGWMVRSACCTHPAIGQHATKELWTGASHKGMTLVVTPNEMIYTWIHQVCSREYSWTVTPLKFNMDTLDTGYQKLRVWKFGMNSVSLLDINVFHCSCRPNTNRLVMAKMPLIGIAICPNSQPWGAIWSYWHLASVQHILVSVSIQSFGFTCF